MTVGEKSDYIGVFTSHSQGEDFWGLVVDGIIVREGVGEVPEDVEKLDRKELRKNHLLFGQVSEPDELKP